MVYHLAAQSEYDIDARRLVQVEEKTETFFF